MRCVVILCLLTLLPVACGGGGAGDTPKESFEAWKSVLSDKDWDAGWELVPPSDRAKADEERKKEGANAKIAREFKLSADEVESLSSKELFARVLEKVYEEEGEELKKLAAAEYVREEIEGTRAKVTYRVDGEEDDLRMLLEDGKWYVRFDF